LTLHPSQLIDGIQTVSKHQKSPLGHKPTTAVAALSFEIGALGSVKDSAHLLPVGPFRATDGRPYECTNWLLDADIAARVITRMADRANDTLIDYEHQSLNASMNGRPAPAAGWFKKMQWVDGKGLFAVGIDWVADAAEMIAAKKYRYISAVFSYYAATGEVLEIVSVALTNTPALDGLDDVCECAALSRSAFFDSSTNPSSNGGTMDPRDQQIVALTTERDALKANQATSLAALTTERDGLKTQVAALTAERDAQVAATTAAAAEADKAKHAGVLSAALTAGTLSPAQKPWAEKQSLAALTEYLAATKPLLPNERQAGDLGAGGAESLTDVELATCTRMGVSPKDFLAAKK
jgi:phage I-like protein